MKFARGDLVKCLTHTGVPLRGRITMCKGKVIRLVDKDGKRYTTSGQSRGRKIQLRSIRRAPFGVFVLDTQLAKGWRSRRQAADFWEQYCYHAGWMFAYERVHSLADLRYFLGSRTISEHVLLFNGHGSSASGWELSNGDQLNGDTPLKVAEQNRHKLVVFSSCSIGANQKLCEKVKNLLGAQAVVGYRTLIRDPICFIAEPALLQLISYDVKPPAAVDTVVRSMDPWKGLNLSHAMSFPMTCV